MDLSAAYNLINRSLRRKDFKAKVYDELGNDELSRAIGLVVSFYLSDPESIKKYIKRSPLDLKSLQDELKKTKENIRKCIKELLFYAAITDIAYSYIKLGHLNTKKLAYYTDFFEEPYRSAFSALSDIYLYSVEGQRVKKISKINRIKFNRFFGKAFSKAMNFLIVSHSILFRKFKRIQSLIDFIEPLELDSFNFSFSRIVYDTFERAIRDAFDSGDFETLKRLAELLLEINKVETVNVRGLNSRVSLYYALSLIREGELFKGLRLLNMLYDSTTGEIRAKAQFETLMRLTVGGQLARVQNYVKNTKLLFRVFSNSTIIVVPSRLTLLNLGL